MNFCRFFVVILCLIGLQASGATTNDVFLFTSFRGNGEDGLHLLMSSDGYHWSALRQDKSFLRPEIGHKIMRDPSLAQAPDGTFHMVWTCGWTAQERKIFGYANSKDLLHWSPQRAIEVMQDEPKAHNIWAPDLFYDGSTKQWLILWSTTIPGRFAQSDNSGDDGYNHRVYCVTTSDFQNFSPSRLFFDPGFNVIDATMFQAGQKYFLFFKDERKTPLKKNICYSVADHAAGPFSPASEPITGQWVEGPSAIRIKGYTLVYFDHFGEPQHYGAVRSKDMKDWEDCTGETSFPPGHRHGTALKVSKAIAEPLCAAGAD